MIAGLPPAAWALIAASIFPALIVAALYWLRNRPGRRGVSPPAHPPGDSGGRSSGAGSPGS